MREDTMDGKRATMRVLADRGTWFAEIQEHLVEAATDLFRAYGNPVDHSLEGCVDTTGENVVAIIGFGARGVRGAVLLLAPHQVVDGLQPEGMRALDCPEDALLRDVLGEFANMLLGRIKNQLAMRALSPMLATPTTMLGRDLVLPAPRSGLSVWHRFAGATGDIFVRLDATFEPDFALGAVGPAPLGSMREGEMTLFDSGPESR
jgi:CheY-specific phosphatase CheX